ncbi:hypothetical protein SEA_JFLIX2_58 [Rhodococcus phage Jflix2]|nr:hypothetical protein SEA_JFLIX2_58 [Rhodococcus phage Jflix2]
MSEYTSAEFDEARRILREAADLIETRGWARFMFETSEGEHCTLGAIRQSADGSIYETRKSAAATSLVAKELRDRGFKGDAERDYSWVTDDEYRREAENFDLVTDWNDADERAAEEVVRLLREAGRG